MTLEVQCDSFLKRLNIPNVKVVRMEQNRPCSASKTHYVKFKQLNESALMCSDTIKSVDIFNSLEKNAFNSIDELTSVKFAVQFTGRMQKTESCDANIQMHLFGAIHKLNVIENETY